MDKGLKTTYYLRTLQASNVEKSTVDVKKEQRGHMATTTAATAATKPQPRGLSPAKVRKTPAPLMRC